jgi:hypothetical protein
MTAEGLSDDYTNASCGFPEIVINFEGIFGVEVTNTE